VGERLVNAMNFFNGMMLEFKQMKCEYSEWIPQLDNDKHD